MNEPIFTLIAILALGTVIIGELLSGDVWKKPGAARMTRKDNPFSYWLAITTKLFLICIFIWRTDTQKLFEANTGYKTAMIVIIISWACVVALLGFFLNEKEDD